MLVLSSAFYCEMNGYTALLLAASHDALHY